MKHYLSFGAGVNSVAMMLYCLDEGWDFEAIFVDHGTDWPETYEYFDMFQEWLIKQGVKPITVLKPDVEGFDNLYNFCIYKQIIPSIMFRWCTDKFKISVLLKYYKKPCSQLIGIDFDEAKRARISTEKDVENRYPLIEAKISRQNCKDIIKNHRLPIPIKSGCFICPYQKTSQWKELRIKHPDLFYKAVALEKRNMKYRILKGKKPMTLSPRKKTLRSIVGENQYKLFKQDEYPPLGDKK